MQVSVTQAAIAMRRWALAPPGQGFRLVEKKHLTPCQVAHFDFIWVTPEYHQVCKACAVHTRVPLSRRKVGVTDTKVRKWLLSISAFLRNQNRGVVDAIELWKKNVDKASVG